MSDRFVTNCRWQASPATFLLLQWKRKFSFKWSVNRQSIISFSSAGHLFCNKNLIINAFGCKFNEFTSKIIIRQIKVADTAQRQGSDLWLQYELFSIPHVIQRHQQEGKTAIWLCSASSSVILLIGCSLYTAEVPNCEAPLSFWPERLLFGLSVLQKHHLTCK